jgi:uncharacterized membrane protein
MAAIVAFVRKTAVGGVLFLLPVTLAVFLIGHLLTLLRPPARKLAALVGQSGISPFWLTVILVIVLVAVAFLAGLVAATAAGRLVARRLESLVLMQMPGYGLLKRAASEAAGNLSAIGAGPRDTAVMIRNGDGWQLGFVMADVGERSCAVFLPDAPTPESGTLLFVAHDRIADSGMNTAEALACLRRLGAGARNLVLPALT